MDSIVGIGSGIFLFIEGAIVAYALNFNVKWVNQNLIGYLFMREAALVFFISLFSGFKKRSTTVSTHSAVVSGSGKKSISTEKKRHT